MKVHLFKYVESAHKAFTDGCVDRDVVLNQTECGYIREKITQDESLVTCKLCLREINKKQIKR